MLTREDLVKELVAFAVYSAVAATQNEYILRYNDIYGYDEEESDKNELHEVELDWKNNDYDYLKKILEDAEEFMADDHELEESEEYDGVRDVQGKCRMVNSIRQIIPHAELTEAEDKYLGLSEKAEDFCRNYVGW